MAWFPHVSSSLGPEPHGTQHSGSAIGSFADRRDACPLLAPSFFRKLVRRPIMPRHLLHGDPEAELDRKLKLSRIRNRMSPWSSSWLLDDQIFTSDRSCLAYSRFAVVSKASRFHACEWAACMSSGSSCVTTPSAVMPVWRQSGLYQRCHDQSNLFNIVATASGRFAWPIHLMWIARSLETGV